jgi:NTE family protein
LISKVGLALSGGAARGIAHLGVFQAIDELGIEINALSGTSSGAIVAAFYASGVPPYEVLQIIKKTRLLKFVQPAISKTGLLKVEKLQKLFRRHLPVDSFQGLKKKLTITATDIVQGETRYFDQGQLIPPILASCCMPVIFDPMVIDGVSYIDGGILNNLPVEPLQHDCEIIIGSHCNPVAKDFKIKNAKGLLERTLLMAIRNNTSIRQQHCHFFIEPPRLGRYIGSDFDKSEELFQIGYDYVKQHSEDLLKVVRSYES